MIDIRRFALNRIICPTLSLEEFFRLAADLGLSKVELRNDLPGGRITDDMKPAQAAALAEKHGVKVITINALQKFNLAAVKARVSAELEEMLDTAAALRCPAVVLCPNNETTDTRDAVTRLAETAAALSAFGPSFVRRGILGYVEPLGFAECSLPSIKAAVTAIRQSGQPCFRTVYDTFHHYLGPDAERRHRHELRCRAHGPHPRVGSRIPGREGKVPRRAPGASRSVRPHLLPGADQAPREARATRGTSPWSRSPPRCRSCRGRSWRMRSARAWSTSEPRPRGRNRRNAVRAIPDTPS